MKPRPPLILASASPRRVELLRQITPEFHVAPSNETELTDHGMSPRRLCEVNAQRKAFAVAARFPEHLVLGADTLVFLDDAALGKPASLDEARAMLGRLAGRIHEVVTGVCLVHRGANRAKMFSEVTRVKFRPLSDTDIADYFRRVDPLDKAGAYAIQEEGNLIVEQVEGSHSNVVGLPIEQVRAALESW